MEVAQNEVDLMADFDCKAQCYVIESNFDEKANQITATVLVKKGTLHQDEVFVCGQHEGRVRFMRNDQGKNVSKAFPGQAVHLAGFKNYPEVGMPLYGCKNNDDAQFIISRVASRREKEDQIRKQEAKDAVD